ncbi:MAG: hypothetical protein AAGE89_03850 [Pseudomonadota bacterium]
MFNFKKIAKALALTLVAGTMAFSVAEITNPSVAEAASITKKVKFGGKFIGKGFAQVEKLGRHAQKKRGIGRVTGGILKNVGSAGRKGTGKATSFVNGASKAGSKVVGKSRVGRAAQNGWRKAGRFQNNAVNKTFRNCRGKACNFTKGAVKFALPF